MATNNTNGSKLATQALAADEYWNRLDDIEKRAQVSGGGKATICRAKIQWGYKVMAKGHNDSTSLFRVEGDSFDTAKALAIAFADQVNQSLEEGQYSARPNLSICITKYKEGALHGGKPVVWKSDEWVDIESVYTNKDGIDSDGKAIVIPALKACGIIPGSFDAWVLLKQKKTTTGRQDNKADGTKTDHWVTYPVKVFKSQEEAYADPAAQASENDTPQVAIPTDWDFQTWQGEVARIRGLIANKPEGAQRAIAVKQLSDLTITDVQFVNQVLQVA